MPHKRKSHGDTKKVSFSSCFSEEELRNGVKSPNCAETLLVFQLLGVLVGFCLISIIDQWCLVFASMYVRACVRALYLYLAHLAGWTCMRKNVRLCKTPETVLRDNLVRLGVCAFACAGSGTGRVKDVRRTGEAGRIVLLWTFRP